MVSSSATLQSLQTGIDPYLLDDREGLGNLARPRKSRRNHVNEEGIFLVRFKCRSELFFITRLFRGSYNPERLSASQVAAILSRQRTARIVGDT